MILAQTRTYHGKKKKKKKRYNTLWYEVQANPFI